VSFIKYLNESVIMPYQKRKSKESYGSGKGKRLRQLRLARDAKRIADESGASATSGPSTSMPAPESETMVDAAPDISCSSSDSDKEVIIDVFLYDNNNYLCVSQVF